MVYFEDFVEYVEINFEDFVFLEGNHITWLVVVEDFFVDEVVGDGVDGEAGEGVDLELADDVASVGHDCIDGDEQVAGNLLVGHTLYEAHNNLLLALGDDFGAVRLLNHARDAG